MCHTPLQDTLHSTLHVDKTHVSKYYMHLFMAWLPENTLKTSPCFRDIYIQTSNWKFSNTRNLLITIGSQSPPLRWEISYVWMCKNICTMCLVKQLSERLSGPFWIESVVGNSAYSLSISLKQLAIYPVFYVSLLKPVCPSILPAQHEDPPKLVRILDHSNWEVSSILHSWLWHKKFKYLFKWTG